MLNKNQLQFHYFSAVIYDELFFTTVRQDLFVLVLLSSVPINFVVKQTLHRQYAHPYFSRPLHVIAGVLIDTFHFLFIP